MHEVPRSLMEKVRSVFYRKVGNTNVEIIKNPTERDIHQITKEFNREFPKWASTEVRSKHDSKGNSYIWRADKATHIQLQFDPEAPVEKIIRPEDICCRGGCLHTRKIHTTDECHHKVCKCMKFMEES